MCLLRKPICLDCGTAVLSRKVETVFCIDAQSTSPPPLVLALIASHRQGGRFSKYNSGGKNDACTTKIIIQEEPLTA